MTELSWIGKMKTYTSREIASSPVSVGFECLDREMFDPEKCYAPLGESGIKLARVQTGWNRCEKLKGVYDFAWLDDIVDNLAANGVESWFNVTFGNAIYMPDAPTPAAVGCMPLLYGDEVITAWLSYVRALAKHYKGRVKRWEIWNEANGKSFWFPGEPNPEQYAEFIRITGKVIREEIPGALIGADTAGIPVGGYLDRLAAALKPGELDFFNYHGYGLVPEKHTPQIKRVRELFDAAGLTGIEINNGESGLPSWAPEKHFCNFKTESDDSLQAVWMLRRFFLDAFLGAKLISFFHVSEWGEKVYETATGPRPNAARYGLFDRYDYNKKESFYVISRLAALMRDDFAPADIPFSGMTEGTGFDGLPVQYMTFCRGGEPIYAYYLPSSIEDRAKTLYDFRPVLGEVLSDPVLTDMLTGDVYEFPAGEALPIARYPLLITNRSVVL